MVKLDNGASLSIRPATQAEKRKVCPNVQDTYGRDFWHYVCRNASGKIVASGSDLSSAYKGWGYLDADDAARSLLGFGAYFGEAFDLGYPEPNGGSDEISQLDRDLGAWYSENENSIMNCDLNEEI